jgi:hypothetical protein
MILQIRDLFNILPRNTVYGLSKTNEARFTPVTYEMQLIWSIPMCLLQILCISILLSFSALLPGLCSYYTREFIVNLGNRLRVFFFPNLITRFPLEQAGSHIRGNSLSVQLFPSQIVHGRNHHDLPICR